MAEYGQKSDIWEQDVEIRLLGPVAIRDQETNCDLGGPRRRAVLAVLVLEAGRWVALDRLVELVWGDAHARAGRNAVQAHISRLRRAIAGCSGVELRTVGRGYVLDVEPEAVDVFRFRRLVDDAGRAGSRERGVELLGCALGMWDESPLGDVNSEWLSVHVARQLREEWFGVMERYLAGCIQLGNYVEASRHLARLTGEYPERERLHELLMVALAHNGRRSEALETYRALRRQLIDHFGIEPSAPLQALHADILRSGDGNSPLTAWLGESPTRVALAGLPGPS